MIIKGGATRKGTLEREGRPYDIGSSPRGALQTRPLGLYGARSLTVKHKIEPSSLLRGTNHQQNKL
jgi:hypothetical protein